MYQSGRLDGYTIVLGTLVSPAQKLSLELYCALLVHLGG